MQLISTEYAKNRFLNFI